MVLDLVEKGADGVRGGVEVNVLALVNNDMLFVVLDLPLVVTGTATLRDLE